MIKANLLFVATLLPLVYPPHEAIAASDPTDPDCPIVADIRDLARKVDVFNGICVSPSELCGSLLEEINNDAQEYPGIISEQTGSRLFFDPDVVFDTIDYYSAFPHVFDCEPEDEDCDGKTTNLQTIRSNIVRDGDGHSLLYSFPTSNIIESLR